MNTHQPTTSPTPDARTHAFYLDALAALDRAHVPYVVGGGYAMTWYTGIVRHTKDLDLFVRAGDAQPALDVLAAAGYRTEWPWPHFLGKAMTDYAFVDVLYNSGNLLCPVDDDWFRHARDGRVLGRIVPLCPPEEILWTKAFVMERDRYDGADVAHLLLAWGDRLDWRRLLQRFESRERVLLAHLVLFGYIFPSQRDKVPAWVLRELGKRVQAEPATGEHVCNGLLLGMNQYLDDVNKWGYGDPRPIPGGPPQPDPTPQLTPA